MSDVLTQDELALLDRITAETIEPVAPPANVRGRVLEAIRGVRQLDESIPAPEVSRTVRAEEGRWSTIAPGARLKKLSKDVQRNTMTCLLELEPNAIAPAHDHHGKEDTFVVRGSCRVGGMGLYAGDFHHVEAGTHHGDVVASEEGCLLLLTFELEEVA